jgi:toluene monooxygenase system protein B
MGTPMPVVTVFRGDAFYFVALIEDTDTVATVGEKCAEHAVGRRIPPSEAPLRVEYDGRFLEPTQSAIDAGIEPMGTVYVSFS